MSSAPSADRRLEQVTPGDDLGDPLLACVSIVCALHGRPVSEAALIAGLPPLAGLATAAQAERAARRHGLSARTVRRRLEKVSALHLPCVLLLEDGEACVLLARDGNDCVLALPETPDARTRRPVGEVEASYTGHCLLLHPNLAEFDAAAEHAPLWRRSWFWGTLWRFKGYYLEALLAAVLVNVLAVATSLFIMNVYDRVVPNNAVETLIVLATGTLVAIGFELAARSLRSYFLDVAGKKADLLLASILFQQALGLKLEVRPPSAGAFAANLREFESLRDFMTSATLTTLFDLPFAFFFIWVISLVGGPLYQVPLIAVPVVLLVGVIAQVPLAYLMRKHMREASLKHGVLVESVSGTESLKAMNAEGAMQGRWEHYTALTNRTSTGARLISSLVVNVTQAAQQVVNVMIVVWGVFLIAEATITVGALIACVILSGRALAPLGQLAGLMARYQQARAAYFALDALMKQPVERPRERHFLARNRLEGHLSAENVSFGYPGSTTEVLRDLSFSIRAGERVGILGRVGTGKTTLLKLLMGFYQPVSGTLLVDGVDIAQIDPVDLRRNMGYIGQESRLFSGTLRENITLGLPQIADETVLEIATLAAVHEWASRHPMGYDLPVGEGGVALSGGQRQTVALARALLHQPPVLLLDEPTSAINHTSEAGLLARLDAFSRGRTVVLVTHKPSMLRLVDRLLVIEDGRVAADGPRDAVLEALSKPRVERAR